MRRKIFKILCLLGLMPGLVQFSVAAEFEVVDKLTVNGYTLLKSSADVQGNGFSVGGSTFSVQYGKVGVGTPTPFYLLHVSSSAGVSGDLVVISTGASNLIRMTGTGTVYANRFIGDISGAWGIAGADNLGDHNATTRLNMGANQITGSGSVTMSSFTATGLGVSAAQLRLASANGVVISSEASAALGGGIRVSTNVYIVGFASSTRYYGDGSYLTGLGGTLSGGQAPRLPYWTSGSALGNSNLSRDSATSLTAMASTFTVQGNAFSVNGSAFMVSVDGVGIGTGTPSGQLDVRSSVSDPVRWGSSSGPLGKLAYAAGVVNVGGLAGQALSLEANNAAVMRLTAAGTVGVGTTAPASKFDVLNGSVTVRGTNAGVVFDTASRTISPETSAALGSGVRVSTNVYIVGFSSAAKYYGDGSALTGTGDNMGDHNATMRLNMGAQQITGSGSATMSSFTATGLGVSAAQLRLDAANNVTISSENAAAFGKGVRISTNVYIVGFASATRYFGDGSSLTGIGGNDNLGNHTATQDLNLSSLGIINLSTISASGIYISSYGVVQTTGRGLNNVIGDSRGVGAVDLQAYRGTAAQVASGGYAALSGGQMNLAAGEYSVVSGGIDNQAGGYNATVTGGSSNRATGAYSVVAGDSNVAAGESSAVGGGAVNRAVGMYSGVPGGYRNSAVGTYSMAAGYNSSSTANGTFTWSDSQGVMNQNSVQDRTVFKNRGGFLVTGSTNPAMSGTLNRGVFITGNGLMGIATGTPGAALDAVATGLGDTVYTQIWRDSDGIIRASMTASGKLFANVSAASGGGDNLGSHSATQNLQMNSYQLTGTGPLTMSSVTATGSLGVSAPRLLLNPGVQLTSATTAMYGGLYVSSHAYFLSGASLYNLTAVNAAQLRLAAANSVTISSEAAPALGGGVRVSTNVYIVGFTSATKYYGDGSNLTGLSTLDNTKVLKTGDTMTGQLTLSGSSLTVTGLLGLDARRLALAPGIVISSHASTYGGGILLSTLTYTPGLIITSFGELHTTGVGLGAVVGNARGTGAVDLQVNRALVTQVANGGYAVISGGQQNTAAGLYSVVSGGSQNTAGNQYASVGGGVGNNASGDSATIPGGNTNAAAGAYSFAAGRSASSYADGSFTWADSGGVMVVNNAANRALFKAGGGFMVTGSTNTAMSGTANRGVFITGNGLIGISTGTPGAALDAVATGTGDTNYTQIWRDSGGIVRASMTASGKLYADISGSLGGGDNLGNHTAGQNIRLGAYYLSGDGGNEGLSVDAAGMVGIGTLTPSNELEILGSNSPRLAIRSNSEAVGESQELGFQVGVGANASANTVALLRARITQANPAALKGELLFQTNDGDSMLERMLISDRGNIGVSSSTPGYRLVVSSGAGEAGTILAISTGASTMIELQGDGDVIARRFVGDGSALTGIPGDNLGNHIATQTLQMQNYGINTSSHISAAAYQINGSSVLVITSNYGLHLGVEAGKVNSGSYNTFVGYQSGINTAGANFNSFFGAGTGNSNSTGLNNTFVGYRAGYDNVSGNNNTYVGWAAGYQNVGKENTFLGTGAGRYNLNGAGNIVLGYTAGQGVTGNSYSSATLVGYRSGYNLTTGSDNTFLGWNASSITTTGSGNIIIGYNSQPPAADTNNYLNIGGLLHGDMALSTMTVYGDLYADKFYGDGSGLTGVGGGDSINVSTINATATTPYGGVNITTNTFVQGSLTVGTTTFAGAKLVVDNSGDNSPALQLLTTGSKPTCAAVYRGALFFEQSGAGGADKLYICMKMSTDAYQWVQAAIGN